MNTMNIEWKKCPSVQTHGKPYFWFARSNGHRYHVVWNRREQMWDVQQDEQHLIWARSDTAGKGYVAELD